MSDVSLGILLLLVLATAVALFAMLGRRKRADGHCGWDSGGYGIVDSGDSCVAGGGGDGGE